MFKRCLLGSIILHIAVIAGAGSGMHKAPVDLDRITYFQLVTGIQALDSQTGPSSLKTGHPRGNTLASHKADSGSVRSQRSSTTANAIVWRSSAPESGYPGNEMVEVGSKPAPGTSPGQSGISSGNEPGGSMGLNPGTGFDANYLDGTGTPRNGILVIPPRRIYSPSPEYPIIAQRNNWQGLVTLRALIKIDGTIGDITISESSGYEPLDRSALRTVKKWRYQPAMRQGTAVECYLRIPVRFQLEE